VLAQVCVYVLGQAIISRRLDNILSRTLRTVGLATHGRLS